ncbi:MAG: hypothetical protein KF689_14130 [Gemmatimonadaceae bacterium]|nr:hypothetical protein [Gemmatimonadaceae bacterium]MCW5826875.1 hypothetical protein [Gemmatimonadaceae bacterium]
MILGSGDPTPYDATLQITLVVLAALLLTGALTHAHWSPMVAAVTRRSAVIIGVIAFIVVHLRTPSEGSIVAAGRILTLWPALAAVVLIYGIWSWRAGRL